MKLPPWQASGEAGSLKSRQWDDEEVSVPCRLPVTSGSYFYVVSQFISRKKVGDSIACEANWSYCLVWPCWSLDGAAELLKAYEFNNVSSTCLSDWLCVILYPYVWRNSLARDSDLFIKLTVLDNFHMDFFLMLSKAVLKSHRALSCTRWL